MYLSIDPVEQLMSVAAEVAVAQDVENETCQSCHPSIVSMVHPTGRFNEMIVGLVRAAQRAADIR